MNEKIFKFEQPTQIMFLDMDGDEPRWLGGIGYESNIICGCCGGLIELADLWLDWENCKDDPLFQNIETPLKVFDNWVDINEEIIGS